MIKFMKWFDFLKIFLDFKKLFIKGILKTFPAWLEPDYYAKKNNEIWNLWRIFI